MGESEREEEAAAAAPFRIMGPNQLLRQRDAARYLGVSPGYFRRFVGVRPVALPSGGTGARGLFRYKVADIDRWVDTVNNPRSRKFTRRRSPTT